MYEHYEVPRSTFTDWAKALKGDEPWLKEDEPWVDDVYDDLLEGLEAKDGQGAAVSPHRIDRLEERVQEQEVRTVRLEQKVRSLEHSQWGSGDVNAGPGFGDGDSGSAFTHGNGDYYISSELYTSGIRRLREHLRLREW